MEWRTRLLGTAGLVLAIALGVVFIGGSDDDEENRPSAGAAGSSIPGEKAPPIALEQPEKAPARALDEPFEPEPGTEEFKAVESIKQVRAPLDDIEIDLEDMGGSVKGCGQTCHQQIKALDLEPICDLMSEDAKRHAIDFYRRASGRKEKTAQGVDPFTCEDGVYLTLVRSVGLGGPEALETDVEVVGVSIDGDQATATIKRGKTLTSMALVKEDGEWKLPPPVGWDLESKDEAEK